VSIVLGTDYDLYTESLNFGVPLVMAMVLSRMSHLEGNYIGFLLRARMHDGDLLWTDGSNCIELN
jgi:hypothetical protein